MIGEVAAVGEAGMDPALFDVQAPESVVERGNGDDSAGQNQACSGEGVVEGETPAEEESEYASADWGADRDLWMYRDRTVALLRRYARLAVETGRLPSLLGREFFRAKVTSYHVATFEDTVIFVHDVEQSLEKLGWFQKKVIAMLVLEEFTQEEAAQLLQCSPRTVGRTIYEALDRLSEIFVAGSILKPMEKRFPNRETACQGGKTESIAVSDCNEGKNKFYKMSDFPPQICYSEFIE